MKPQESIDKARQTLIGKGICAVDGSGDPDVEGLFTRLSAINKALDPLDEVDKQYLDGEMVLTMHEEYLTAVNEVRKLLGREVLVELAGYFRGMPLIGSPAWRIDK